MSLMLKELKEAPSIYRKRLSAEDEALQKLSVEAAARNIDCIVTAARGTSANATLYFKQLEELFYGLPVSFSSPYLLTAKKADLKLSNSLFVAVSQSGGSPDTLAMTKQAMKCGALALSLTNNAQSAVAAATPYHLDMLAGPENAVAATKTFSAELIALAQLTEALLGKKILSRTLPEITERLLNTIPMRSDASVAASKGIVLLSRGLTEVVAKEAALKFTECTYKFSFASSTNEFMHGPQALVENGTPAILFAPSGDFSADFVKTAEMLVSRGAHLVAFTDIDEVKTLASLCFDMPTLSEADAPLVYAPAMQLFVEAVTCALGLSPDAPRNLNKITITT